MTDENGAGWRRLLVVWSARLTLRPSSLLAGLFVSSDFAEVGRAVMLLDGDCNVGGGIGIGTSCFGGVLISVDAWRWDFTM
jgi:hypothetical protein